MNQTFEYRELSAGDIQQDLLCGFERHQTVTKIRRKLDGTWQIADNPFIDDWSQQDRQRKIMQLKQTIEAGGYVAGAFAGGMIKGFVSVGCRPFGSRQQYVELSSLHVSKDMRGHGIGRRLFCMAAQHAGRQGFRRLYISAHSAMETQAFYRAMGCTEAEEYSAAHVEREPLDCQMEYRLD